MPAKPRIFISAVSAEFRQLRQLTANVLLRLGYDPVWQDILGTEGGDLRDVLSRKIDSCQGVLQIVGQGYGFEPETVDPEFGRISYTQFELVYAQQAGKKTWIVFAEDGCSRDKPVGQLDLPEDPDHPDPAGYQSERRALQGRWRERLKQTGHLHHAASSDTELELRVERLKDELTELMRSERVWRKAILSGIGALILLAVVAVVLIAKLGTGSRDAAAVSFADIDKDDIRPEISNYYVMSDGIVWNLEIKCSGKVSETLMQNGNQLYYSLDGTTYHKGLAPSAAQIADGLGANRLYLRYESFEGEELGPFVYDIDFNRRLRDQLREELESPSSWFTKSSLDAWTIDFGVFSHLAVVDRIEYGFDPDLQDAKQIVIPEVSFETYFRQSWQDALPFRHLQIQQPDDESRELFFRFIYRNGAVGRTKKVTTLGVTGKGMPPTAAPPREQATSFDSMGKDDLSFKWVRFKKSLKGWELFVQFPSGISLKMRDPRRGITMHFSLDGEHYEEAYSESFLIQDWSAIDSNRVLLKLISQAGDEVGPFEYKLDFRKVAEDQLREEAEQAFTSRSTLLFRDTPNGYFANDSAIQDYISVIDRIEYSEAEAFDNPQAFKFPTAEFRDYFDRSSDYWSSFDIYEMGFPKPDELKTIYYRLVFRDGTTLPIQKLKLEPRAGGGLGGL